METVVALPVAYGVGKGVANVGVLIHSVYRAYKNELQNALNNIQRDLARLDIRVAQVGEGVADLRQGVHVIIQEIQRVFDSQASLLLLFTQGANEIYARLDFLRSEINKGFRAVVQTVRDEAAAQDAREFRRRLGLATENCSHILADILMAAEEEGGFPACARTDIERAWTSAAELYQWASAFVSDGPGEMTKQAKLREMPYIVAMAYAARIKIVTLFMERDMVEKEKDKAAYVNRAREIVNSFTAVLISALEGLIANTSLLEIAFDYHLPMVTYMTLLTSFPGSVDELLTPSAESRVTAVWNDGLSLIRKGLLWKERGDADDQGQGRQIKLCNVGESVWWATFIDTNLNATHASELRTSIDIREVCHVLGAGSDERIPHVTLNPGQKSALTQLPPASALRADLAARIAKVREKAQGAGPWPPESFARISPPPPVGQLRTAATAAATAAAAVPIAAAAPLHFKVVAPRTFSGHSNRVFGLAACANGERVVSGSWDGTARVWSLSSGKESCSFSNHTSDVNCVAMSADGKRAVSGSDDASVRVWSVDSGNAQRTFRGHSGWVMSVAVSPDKHRIASGSKDKTVRVWNVCTSKCEATLRGHAGAVNAVAFSPNGARLVSGSDDSSVIVWDVRTHELKLRLCRHSGAVNAVAVTPDGQRLVSGSEDEVVKVWSLSSGVEGMEFQHEKAVKCVAVFPDGQRIVSGSFDRSIRVWNLRSRTLEIKLTGHIDHVQSIAVSPDGQRLVWADTRHQFLKSKDNAIKVWDLSEQSGGKPPAK